METDNKMFNAIKMVALFVLVLFMVEIGVLLPKVVINSASIAESAKKIHKAVASPANDDW